MVGNFREGFIFVFFASQEPFAKIKTAKILSSKCKTNELSFTPQPTYNYIVANRTVSVSVPLTAIAEALQEIKMLRRHRCTNQTAAEGRERKQTFTTNVLGTRVLFSLHWNKELNLPSLFVSDSRHLLSF